MPRDPKMLKARSVPKEKAADSRVTRQRNGRRRKFFGLVEDILPTPNTVIDASPDCRLRASKIRTHSYWLSPVPGITELLEESVFLSVDSTDPSGATAIFGTVDRTAR
jgi:hypothetical protein